MHLRVIFIYCEEACIFLYEKINRNKKEAARSSNLLERRPEIGYAALEKPEY